ncbi:hypothetical protein B0H11DRAFT_1822769 [Mycena galericulata]|nr:hypothetical protein B0H11DRAFT_1822769 [Mycena galericulata]
MCVCGRSVRFSSGMISLIAKFSSVHSTPPCYSASTLNILSSRHVPFLSIHERAKLTWINPYPPLGSAFCKRSLMQALLLQSTECAGRISFCTKYQHHELAGDEDAAPREVDLPVVALRDGVTGTLARALKILSRAFCRIFTASRRLDPTVWSIF